MDESSSQESIEMFEDLSNCTSEDESQQYRPTQPIDSDTLSQSVLHVVDGNSQDSHEEEKPWGYLMGLLPKNKQCYPLVKNEITVGRDAHTCDILFGDYLGRHLEQTSRNHFKIIRSVDGHGGHIVSVQNLSAGGTLVGKTSVEKNQARPLFHLNKIAILHRLDIEVFEFQDLNYGRSIPGIPNEITSNYTFLKDVGRGGFGSVYSVVKHSTAERLAMKAIKFSSENGGGSLLDEANIMYKIRHPNIVSLCETYTVGNALFLFMELVPGGDLFQYMNARQRGLSEIQAKCIFYQMVCAVSYLHSQKIVHRDLKPGNVLCSDKEDSYPIVKLIDFGTSRFLNDIELVHTFCGTRTFAAPELNTLFFSNIADPSRKFDSRCDIWSLGLIFYYCLSKNLPFLQGEGKPPLAVQIQSKDVEFRPSEVWRQVSPTAKSLIRFMTMKKFVDRPTSGELLKNRYFQEDGTFKSIYNRRVMNKASAGEAQKENQPQNS